MTEPRIEIVTPCEHDQIGSHYLDPDETAVKEWRNQHGRYCFGGSRLVYTREEAINRVALAVIATEVTDKRRGLIAPRAVDALLGVGE